MEKDKIIEELYQIIDDIDTYSDMTKGDYEAFYKLTMKRQLDKNKTGLESDGYNLNIHQIYKECVFEKFKNGECVVCATNTVSGHSWIVKEHEVEIMQGLVNKSIFRLFAIPNYVADCKEITVVV